VEAQTGHFQTKGTLEVAHIFKFLAGSGKRMKVNDDI
jgi:hypothetical protein